MGSGWSLGLVWVGMQLSANRWEFAEGIPFEEEMDFSVRRSVGVSPRKSDIIGTSGPGLYIKVDLFDSLSSVLLRTLTEVKCSRLFISVGYLFIIHQIRCI